MFYDLPACDCRLHRSVAGEPEWDDGDKKLVSDVVEVGWHLIAVSRNPGQAVVHDDAPVIHVVHESDGDWQFLDGGPTGEEDVAVAHLGEVVDHHPHLNRFHDLPVGWQAWTTPPDPEWHRAPMPD